MPTPTAVGTEPRRGGWVNYTVDGKSPPHFDVQLFNVEYQETVSGAYNALLRMDTYDETKLNPELAERWEVSADGLTYTFYLRKGVKFHDGVEMTSADVVYNLLRVQFAPPGMTSRMKELMAGVVSVTAPDKYTVVVKRDAPNPEFLYNIGSWNMVIYPKHVVEPLDAQKKGMQSTVVGTGPFKFKELVPDISVSLQRFDGYFVPGKPYLDGVTGYIMMEDALKLAALRAGRLQLLKPFSDPQGCKTIQQTMADRAQCLFFPSIRILFFSPQMSGPGAPVAFQDIRVRKALAYALDKKKVSALTGEFSIYTTPGGAAQPGAAFGLTYEELAKIEGYDFALDRKTQLERAWDLMRQAGYPNGLEFTQSIRGTAAYFKDTSIVASQVMSEGPFKVTTKIEEEAAYYDAVAKGTHQGVVHSAGLKTYGISGIIGECCTSGGARNLGSWSDAALDSLWKKVEAEANRDKKVALAKEYQRQFLSTYYWQPVSWGGYFFAWTNDLRGFWVSRDRYSSTSNWSGNVWLAK